MFCTYMLTVRLRGLRCGPLQDKPSCNPLLEMASQACGHLTLKAEGQSLQVKDHLQPNRCTETGKKKELIDLVPLRPPPQPPS